MMISIIVILMALLVISLAVNIWLAGELERIHRESELDWGDPDSIEEVDES